MSETKKKVLWYVSNFGEGSGGHRTVFQNVMALIRVGYECDFLMVGTRRSAEELKEVLRGAYGIDFPGKILYEGDLTSGYDIAIATEWNTAKAVLSSKTKQKLYFIQDYEPWFFPMSEKYLEAQETYKYGFRGISIGKWLSGKISRDFGAEMRSFSFCADLDIYKRDKNAKTEDAVCFIFQPGKPRRCAEMGLKALQIVKKERPETKIYLYGSEKAVPFNLEAEHLGMLSAEGCNELYNRCKVGLCLSSSNPSRIPFEMMATGLPVVDLYLENNLYDLPEDGCLLAEPSAESIARAILKLLNDEVLRRGLSSGGAKYMKSFPLSRGFEGFKEIINDYSNEKKTIKSIADKIYRKKAVRSERIDYDLPIVFFKTDEQLQREKEEKERAEEEKRRLEEEARKALEEKKWRENLTFWQRVYLKIRYILIGR